MIAIKGLGQNTTIIKGQVMTTAYLVKDRQNSMKMQEITSIVVENVGYNRTYNPHSCMILYNVHTVFWWSGILATHTIRAFM